MNEGTTAEEISTKKDKQKTVTQKYYDETVIENEETFEWDSNKAVYETVQELKSQNVCLDNIITLHPNSDSGKKARENLKKFESLVSDVLDNIAKGYCGEKDVVEKESVMTCLEELTRYMFMLSDKKEAKNENNVKIVDVAKEGFEVDFLELFLKFGGIRSILILVTSTRSTESMISESIQFLMSCLLQSRNSAIKRKIQDEVNSFIPDCMRLLKEYPFLIKLMSLACQGHEQNKVTIVSNDAPEILISLVSNASSNQMFVCQLISSLCRYDDPSAVISSAHQNVLSFVNSGLLDPLFTVVQSELQKKTDDKSSTLLCSIIMTTFRTLSINDEIIQQLLTKDILPVLNQSFMLAFQTDSLHLARANLGVVRNMCQNDDIKCTFCHDYLKMLLEVVGTYIDDYQVQEHFCAIIGAMALRYLSNARKIVLETNAVEYIIAAMKRYPQNVTLQRQACLAIRNVVSRDDTSDKQLSSAVLELGAEQVLKEAGMFLGSVDEAYAALRDLGCKISLLRVDKETGEVHVGVEMFGEVKTGFRPYYEESKNL